jgi:hypothetical protein
MQVLFGRGYTFVREHIAYQLDVPRPVKQVRREALPR